MKRTILNSLVACLLLVGMVSVSRAGSPFTTFTTTAVCLTTATEMEVLKVIVGSGTNVQGDCYVLLVDTRPLVLYSTGGTIGAILNGANYTVTKFPVSQWIIPPIIVFSTVTLTGQVLYSGNGSGQTIVDLQSATGEGVSIMHGLTVFIVGRNDMPVSVQFRKKLK